MHQAPPVESRELLPPLLACLPTTFISPRPPPALLPLLAPVLRQRCAYIGATATGNDGWVKLLSWDAERAAKLPSIVEHLDLEPHPVSGEVEIDDPRAVKYRRLDDETLHARLELDQFDLSPTYLWCETDEHGDTGAGWKLADLRSLEDIEEDVEWYSSISEAETAASTTKIDVPQTNGSGQYTVRRPAQSEPEEEEEDDDYWASYDRTPGRTPAQKLSPAPPTASNAQQSGRQRTQSELQYFERYGSEVQPAMDGHDPDEDHPEIGESTLNGDSFTRGEQHHPHEDPLARPQTTENDPPPYRPESREPWQKALYPHDSARGSTALEQGIQSDLSMPRPISPTSSHSSVAKLESEAEAMSSAESSSRAEIGIKQHISTDIKSLFRLAKSVGMERKEFERIVRTELDVLGMMEQDE